MNLSVSRDPSRTRRNFLRALGLAGLSGLTGCNTTPDSNLSATQPSSSSTPSTGSPTHKRTDLPTETEYEQETVSTGIDWEVEPLEPDLLVGIQYYAWYWGDGGYGRHTLRPWLEHTPYTPELGQYDSRNEDIINQHIEWAVEHGINWFILTNGAPGSRLDRNIQDVFLHAELIDEIDWSLTTGFDHFPVTVDDGRTDMDSPGNRDRLRRWFEHFEDNFFHDPNYLYLDGRPVLFDFSTPSLAGDIEGAFEEAKAAIDTDPYIVANPRLFWAPPATEPSTAYDAIKKYSTLQSDGDYTGFPAELGWKSREWLFRSKYHDMDYIPTVMPGYNDQEIDWAGRTKHPIMDLSPEEFREVCQQALKYVDPDLEAVVITSWNEFPEGTSIEPAEEYGHTRLEIVKEEVALKEANPLPVDEYSLLELDFNKSIQPAAINEESSDERWLSFMAGGLDIRAGDEILTYNIGVPEEEPVFAHGAYRPNSDARNSPSSWRWLGGPDALTALYVAPKVSGATDAVLNGKPMVDNAIEADVYHNGQLTDHVAFGERSLQTYDVVLGA